MSLILVIWAAGAGSRHSRPKQLDTHDREAAFHDLIAAGEAEGQLLPTRARWLGVTYCEHKPRVAAALLDLTHAGDYPLAFTEAAPPVLPP